ncbi:hypothetical protein Goshw_020551 [Gossypium schwendimanii]|uniref:DUF7745 domain-containing protein n=1 Tax=Gossypium schwendimanii TaxID=34291 RepID=A0A7J9NEL3_GOSSC|nr:hypothetical protein [Gossypium schwendimanii]
MEKGFLDKIEDNAAVRIWAETTHIIQNYLREMKEIWDQWDNETKQLFYCNYGDLPYLLNVKVDKYLFRALTQFWNPAYSCFIFKKVDLVPTVEEHTTLLRCLKIQVDKAYSKAAILVHPDVKKRVDVFTLGIYGLVIFPKALGHIDEAVFDLFDRLGKGI